MLLGPYFTGDDRKPVTLNAVAVLVGCLINGNMRKCSGILSHFSLLKA